MKIILIVFLDRLHYVRIYSWTGNSESIPRSYLQKVFIEGINYKCNPAFETVASQQFLSNVMKSKSRFCFLWLGVAWGLLGILIIVNPEFYHSELRFNFDFTEIKWPFGAAFIILGCCFIWSSFRKKSADAEDPKKWMKNKNYFE